MVLLIHMYLCMHYTANHYNSYYYQISKKEVDHPICDQQDVNPPRLLLLISAWDPSTIPTKPLHCTLRLEGIIEQEETMHYLP